MSIILMPVGSDGQSYVDANGAPRSGAKMFVYLANTSTKTTLFQDKAGGSSHTNPIILNSSGQVANAGGTVKPIFVNSGLDYDVVLAPSTDTDPPVSPYFTLEDIRPINDTDPTLSSEWVLGPTPTYISTTSFTLAGDVTSTFNVGRRVKTANSGGTIYSTIAATAYTTLTTVTVVNDSGVLDSGLSAVYYSLISGTNTSAPTLPIVAKTSEANFFENLAFTATVAGNNLTVTLTGVNLSAPSVSNIVYANFRSTTATSGTYVLRQITGATSVVLAGGQAMGFSSSEDGFMYIYLCDDGSTRQLGICKEAIFDESALITTQAIAAASSATVLYTTGVMSGAAVRLIGRIQIAPTGTNWTNSPSHLAVWNPSMRKTGDVIYRKRTVVATASTGTTIIPYDNTTPQNTEGDQVLTISITPLNLRNILYFESRVHLANPSGSRMTMCLFQDANANALATSADFQTTASGINIVDLNHKMAAGTISNTTFNVRVGSDVAGTTTFNGDSGNAKFNGTLNSFIEVTEIQA